MEADATVADGTAMSSVVAVRAYPIATGRASGSVGGSLASRGHSTMSVAAASTRPMTVRAPRRWPATRSERSEGSMPALGRAGAVSPPPAIAYRNARTARPLLPLPVAMAASSPTYDLTLLLDSTADADRRKKILADAQALIGQHGAVAGTHDWGVRPTTYEIDKQAAAEYHLIQFTSPAPRPLLEELDRTLPITDGVLRYRIIKQKLGVGSVPDLTVGAVEDTPSSDDDTDYDER